MCVYINMSLLMHLSVKREKKIDNHSIYLVITIFVNTRIFSFIKVIRIDFLRRVLPSQEIAPPPPDPSLWGREDQQQVGEETKSSRIRQP